MMHRRIKEYFIARSTGWRRMNTAALLRLNRQLRAISTCNQVLMQASDEQTLLDEICRIVCEEAGYRMAWIGYPQNDEARTIRPVARAGVEEGYLVEAGITWADTERGRGPAGRAIREGVGTCIQDFTTDAQAAPWRQSALQRGYRSSTALPLKDEGGTPFGALCIYSAQPNAFTPDEIRLLEELAGNLAFGITALRIRAEHKKAEMQLLASEQLFRALVENSPDFIARYDREFRRIYVNPAIQKLFGGRTENALGKTPADQSPLYAPQIYIDHLRQAIETATESTAEIPFRTAQGEMHWGHMRFVPEFGPDGKVVSVLAIGRDIHEIKENEQRFRMLAENFPDFVVRFDRDGQYIYANSAVEKAFGMPTEAIVGKTLQELPQRRTPEQNDAFLALIRRAFDEGVPNESEALWDTEIGERIFEIRQAPEKDAAGNVVSVLSIARDITERKQMEQERLAHLRYLENMDRINRAIQENADLEQMMSDVLDVVLSVFECDRACLVYPCDPAAVTWQAPMERTKPECPGALALGLEVPVDPHVARVYKAVLASNDPVGFGPGNENPLPTDVAQRFSERYRLASQLATAIYPKEDKPYMFVIHQCTRSRVWTQEERRLFKEIGRRLEDALTILLMYRNLHDGEERYRMVFENSPVSTWEEDFSAVKTLFDDLKKQGVTDIETFFDRHPETVLHCAESATIIDVNRAALALHGAATKEELLAGLVNTFTPESFDTFRRELVCLWNGETEMTGDAVVKTLAGERRNVTVYFSVCPGHEETLCKVFVSLIDITDRKQTEEELVKYREHLEELVRERTTKLQVANKELDAFAYSVSHDLRAPLRHIDGFLELLQKTIGTALDEQSRHYMEAISEAAQKMGLLIDDLLSFSRMGRHAMSFQPVELGDLVRDVIRELEPDAAGRKIVWRIGDLPTVGGDAAMLRIVLANLIANALKFTRTRQQAHIEIESLPGQDSEAVLFVRDNGVGFDMTYADKLFGVFQRLHRADEFEGTGIGLANVRRIIARHGGRTWAEGKVDHGATFFFSLPQHNQQGA
jgi:PAS domain S-box-containing protein